MHARLFAIAAFVSVLLAPNFAAAATVISDPVKFVNGVYANMVKANAKNSYMAPEDIYTPRLSALFALDTKEAGGEVGRMDFDFWSNAQDWQISGVKVKGLDVESAKDRKIVVARFKNEGKPEEIHLYFERGKKGWLLDDARSTGKDSWTLSLILKYGWADAPQ
ncbi:MAG: DUF3828 domain-containing protein [Proteobacteria bacterium]|nr:DUF3828 domain-containing protein [Pseudomonadota bacterium]